MRLELNKVFEERIENLARCSRANRTDGLTTKFMEPIAFTWTSLFIMFAVVVVVGGVNGYTGHMPENNWRRFIRREYKDKEGYPVVEAGHWADTGMGDSWAKSYLCWQ